MRIFAYKEEQFKKKNSIMSKIDYSQLTGCGWHWRCNLRADKWPSTWLSGGLIHWAQMCNPRPELYHIGKRENDTWLSFFDLLSLALCGGVCSGRGSQDHQVKPTWDRRGGREAESEWGKEREREREGRRERERGVWGGGGVKTENEMIGSPV